MGGPFTSGHVFGNILRKSHEKFRMSRLLFHSSPQNRKSMFLVKGHGPGVFLVHAQGKIGMHTPCYAQQAAAEPRPPERGEPRKARRGTYPQKQERHPPLPLHRRHARRSHRSWGGTPRACLRPPPPSTRGEGRNGPGRTPPATAGRRRYCHHCKKGVSYSLPADIVSEPGEWQGAGSGRESYLHLPPPRVMLRFQPCKRYMP